ncbi:hypothetical protein VFPPC_15224 [Pochonia chlamydosporia 170]|uniref:Uncharacterized protein n=1 Tax=Pochonia chlamydosporia 170 TaxID=1380566 RepID=A0A179G6D0_METCM|nr:hypothetical protein VFPPC_15224 [Pochonia chlamydosporia 170]OAQ72951.1 hypothetical protein VFPPC_15224 [Pochonia chlamydosporia 170]
MFFCFTPRALYFKAGFLFSNTCTNKLQYNAVMLLLWHAFGLQIHGQRSILFSAMAAGTSSDNHDMY